MNGQARPGVVREPGGRATPEDRDPWDQAMIDAGYVLCRPCAEWHRPPECWITEQGVPALDVP